MVKVKRITDVRPNYKISFLGKMTEKKSQSPWLLILRNGKKMKKNQRKITPRQIIKSNKLS